MESPYAADVRLTYEDLLAFNIHYELRKGDKFRMSAMFMLGIGAMLIFYLASDLFRQFNWFYLLYIVIVLLLPVGRYAMIVSRTKKAAQEYSEAGGHSRYEFTETGVLREKTDATGTANTELKYDEYTRILKTKKAFYLYVSEEEVNIIPLGSITNGEPMELAKYLDQQAGNKFVIMG